MKIVKVVVVGFGDRGGAYTKYAIDHPDRLKVQAVVDPNPFRRQLAKERFSLSEEMLFESVTDCVNRRCGHQYHDGRTTYRNRVAFFETRL